MSEIIDSDLSCHLIPAGEDELDEIMRGLLEIRQRHGNKTIDPALVLKHIDILCELGDIFERGTSDPDNFFTLADIESLYLGYRSRLSEADFRNLLTMTANLKGEASLIKKKDEYLQKGVKLKKFHPYESSVMTLAGRVSYKRTALRPSASSDAEKLSAMGHEGFVYPADEALEITKLPFNMTLPVMRTAAEAAVRAGSYEEAEQILRELTNVKVNDDTIRRVTNSLGAMVFKNDLEQTNRNWELLQNSQIVFPEKKSPHVFYMETDGAMLPTREKDEAGSVWRENKLGMVFSSDNFTVWTDKRGEKQHRIDKREFVNYTGPSEEFKRFMFSLAVRNGYGNYKETVLIGDGAAWIRSMKEELFPDAQQILDFYHLCENVYSYAKNAFSADENIYKPWAKEMC